MVSTFLGRAAEQSQDNVLAASVTSIADALRSEGGAVRLELPYSAFSMLGALSDDRVFYRVAIRGGEVLTGYADLPIPQAPGTPGRVRFETVEYSGETVRTATITRTVLADQQPRSVVMTVAQTRSGVTAISSRLSRIAALLSVAFFVLAVSLSTWAARGALRPLNELAMAVSRRGPSDLRPVRQETSAELAPLVDALNRLMGRLADSLRRSEDFIAQAAHRVRTPLATVRTQAEIALHSVEKEQNKRILRRVIRAVDESSRSAGQLLDHATVSFRADDLAQDDIDLAELARDTAEALRPTAEMKDIALDLHVTPAPTRGDAVLLRNALRNLLDNSIKYSPDETTIEIAIRPEPGAWRLTIRDEGRGFGDDKPSGLAERFRRGGNAGDVIGSGLGLTIVAEVARAHGGRLELKNRETGRGACASLLLPSR
jgi:two-component system sensor histidine kinase TctE